MTLTEQQHAAQAWFRTLRDSICAEFEHIEATYQSTPEHSRDRGATQCGEVNFLRSKKEEAERVLSEHPSCERSEPRNNTNPATTFTRTPWQRPEGGGGEISLLKGRVFEKVGVNISTVHGEFSPQFRHEIPGAESDPRFWATGISLVAHPTNPHVPAAHMNTRMIVVGGESGVRSLESTNRPSLRAQRGNPAAGASCSYGWIAASASPPRNDDLLDSRLQTPDSPSRLWFGGGGDLNPAIPYDEDTKTFHAAFQRICDTTHPGFYPAFSRWCDEYFHLPHRNIARGVGGIFYDYLGLAHLGSDTTPVTSGRFGKGGNNGTKTAHGMEVANNAPLSWQDAFTFTQNVGTTFRDTYSALIRQRMHTPFSAAERQQQLIYRGRYAEYNLLYDRGTRFGLMTGGNPDAILMSLPPLAVWE